MESFTASLSSQNFIYLIFLHIHFRFTRVFSPHDGRSSMAPYHILPKPSSILLFLIPSSLFVSLIFFLSLSLHVSICFSVLISLSLLYHVSSFSFQQVILYFPFSLVSSHLSLSFSTSHSLTLSYCRVFKLFLYHSLSSLIFPYATHICMYT